MSFGVVGRVMPRNAVLDGWGGGSDLQQEVADFEGNGAGEYSSGDAASSQITLGFLVAGVARGGAT